jgi:hypothetical protein
VYASREDLHVKFRKYRGRRVVNPAAFHIFRGIEKGTFVNLNI